MYGACRAHTVILVAFAIHTHAQERVANQTDVIQNPTNSVLDENAYNLFSRAVKPSSVHHTNLEDVILGKAGHLTLPTSSFSSRSAFASRQMRPISVAATSRRSSTSSSSSGGGGSKVPNANGRRAVLAGLLSGLASLSAHDMVAHAGESNYEYLRRMGNLYEAEALKMDERARGDILKVDQRARDDLFALDKRARDDVQILDKRARDDVQLLDQRARDDVLFLDRQGRLVEQRARDDALKLDQQGREIQEKDPELFNILSVSEGIALVGAAVGGAVAQRRGIQLEDKNKKLEDQLVVEEQLMEKLKAVNKQLQFQRRVVSKEQETAIERDDQYEATREILKAGRSALKREETVEANVLFDRAYAAAKAAGQAQADLAWKAVRGLAASAQLAGNTKEALAWLERCLELSTCCGERADTLGLMADLYETEGYLETAGKYYDMWLKTINEEGCVIY